MSNQDQYITITHYKEREFYFLNYAIQTQDGFIAKDIEQFHESDKTKFIERIRELQAKYTNNNIVSISLVANQIVSQDNDKNRATAKIFQDTYVTQDEIDVGDVPTTLYFSPFAILYEYYKDMLNDKLTLFIGYFDRKLFMMFATKDKIHQSWIIGTRGLTEKQIAERVYKSMQAYYKISYNFAEHIEMLVAEENPKLLKFLREELSLHIELAQSNIHNLLHHMASSQEIAKSSYIQSFKKIEIPTYREETYIEKSKKIERVPEQHDLNDIKIENNEKQGLFSKVKSLFSHSDDNPNSSILATMLPMVTILVIGTFFHIKNNQILDKIYTKEMQITAHKQNIQLGNISRNIFNSMGKNAELKQALISTKGVNLKGVVWGIEPLKKSLHKLYSGGEFSIKPLENFMTEFSFISKK
jgi:hypothetical protein